MAPRKAVLALALSAVVGLLLGCALQEAPAPPPPPEPAPAPAPETDQDRATAKAVHKEVLRFVYSYPEQLIPRPATRPSYRLADLPELPPELHPPARAGSAVASSAPAHRRD